MISLESPFISVIIPVYNDIARLKLCLQALEEQTYPDECYEVIVVDNNSLPPVQISNDIFPHARVIVETEKGSYVSRNRGLEQAKGDYLAFTDSDCVPNSHWLRTGVDALLTNENLGLVGGDVELFAENESRPTIGEIYETIYAFPIEHYIHDKKFMPTCNLFTTRLVFDVVGVFSSDLLSSGDQDWGQRVHRNGYNLLYLPELKIRHPARKLSEISSKYQRVHRNYAMFRLQGRPRWHAFLQLWFYKAIFFFPRPNDIKKLLRSSVRWPDKLRVFFVLVWLQMYRASITLAYIVRG